MTTRYLRQNYTPYPYSIPHIKLRFDLHLNRTLVHSQFQVNTDQPGSTLILDGETEALELISLRVDGQPLAPHQYELTAHTLSIPLQNTQHLIEIDSACTPATNTTLMGLYQSGQQLFTQCEPEGFRRITWFADRPDVLSQYTVELTADAQQFPYLLSNGNLISEELIESGRKKAIWEDPFAKPSYLFAVVAGDFDCLEQRLHTASGKEVLLQVYSDKGDIDKTEWAMQSLINALRWDEERFGLELDLDRYMIVSASDFNMGAMENKGLNVFNAAYVLAQPHSTTDQSYQDIEAVIGHEYFHNWTGNRVTCRDWFQLSLKEGLTVFREQEFSADQLATGLDGAAAASAKAVKRIDDVSLLRLAQFPEDAGPMAHPIRPNSYEEISNFYTATIYEKGAEIIRMYHTLLGEDGFKTALRTYLQRFDGQAVSCDDFMAVMAQQYSTQCPEQPNSLAAFAGWYEQAGTPRVHVQWDYDATKQRGTLTLTQSNPPVGIERLAQPPAAKPPLLIPIKIGFLDTEGQPLPAYYEGRLGHEFLLRLEQGEQQFIFEQLPANPVLSVLRDFSAPVIMDYEVSTTELLTLARHDSNAFARWQAIQELIHRALISSDYTAITTTWQQLFTEQTELSAAYLSRALALPSVRQLLAQSQPIAPLNTQQQHSALEQHLATHFAQQWLALYHSTNPTTAGQRALKNLALKMLVVGSHPQGIALAQAQYHNATTMTEEAAAFELLVHYGDQAIRQQIVDDFYQRWQHDALVIDRWFRVQASAPYFDAAQALALQQHPNFTLRNPNRARALVFQFCSQVTLHNEAGYDYWCEQVLALDAINPEIAARLCRLLDNWQHYVSPLSEQIKQRFESLAAQPGLSVNTQEIIQTSLNI